MLSGVTEHADHGRGNAHDLLILVQSIDFDVQVVEHGEYLHECAHYGEYTGVDDLVVVDPRVPHLLHVDVRLVDPGHVLPEAVTHRAGRGRVLVETAGESVGHIVPILLVIGEQIDGALGRLEGGGDQEGKD